MTHGEEAANEKDKSVGEKNDLEGDLSGVRANRNGS